MKRYKVVGVVPADGKYCRRLVGIETEKPDETIREMKKKHPGIYNIGIYPRS